MTDWSRRRFLSGVGGVTLALPILESLQPRAARAQTTRDRFIMVVRAGNGIVQEGGDGGERFWPSSNGVLDANTLRTTDSARATSVLADYADKLLMVKKVRLPFARNACSHAEAIPQLLTAMNHSGGAGNTPLALGRSVDWYLSDELNGVGKAPLTFTAGEATAYVGYGLSWSGSRQRAAAERSPRNALMRMTGVTTAPPEVQRLLALRRKSVNDLVREQLRALLSQRQLSSLDKQRLDQHLSVVRDIEVQSSSCELAQDQAARANSITNPESNPSRPEVVKSFMDLAAWAFNCRMNHVATLQVGPGLDTTVHTIDGVMLPNAHFISHRQYAHDFNGAPLPGAVELHHKIDRFQLGLYKHLLDRLSSYTSPHGGTLLDDSVAVWVNDLGSGNHDASNTPWILAGSGGGQLVTGRVIDHAKKTVNQVLNTLINAMGVRKSGGALVDDFGDPSLAKGVVTGALK